MSEPCSESKTLQDIQLSLQKIEIAIFDEKDGMKFHLKETRDILHGKGKDPGLLDDVRVNSKFRKDMNHMGKKIAAGFTGLMAWLVKLQFFNQA